MLENPFYFRRILLQTVARYKYICPLRRDMEAISALLALREENPLVTVGLPSQGIIIHIIDVFLLLWKKTFEQAANILVICDTKMLMWCHYNDNASHESYQCQHQTVWMCHRHVANVIISLRWRWSSFSMWAVHKSYLNCWRPLPGPEKGDSKWW